MNNVNEVLSAVLAHAIENYEQDGWDYMVECWTAEEIESDIVKNNLDTNTKAIAYFGRIVRTLDSVRRDVQAEIF